MGHMVAMAASLLRGDVYAAKAATGAAIACDADPMYMLFARAWATGLSIGEDTWGSLGVGSTSSISCGARPVRR